MVDLFKSVFDEEMFSEIIYVDSNPAVVSILTVSKNNGHIETHEESKTFQLSETDGTYKMLHDFFVLLNFQWHPERINYYRNAIMSLLFGKDKKKLVETVTLHDWAIVTPNILSELKTMDDFRNANDQELIDDETLLKPVGNILGTNIYLVPQQIMDTHSCKSVVYTGLRKSITPVVHTKKNLYKFEINGNGIRKYTIV